jgi:integrase
MATISTNTIPKTPRNKTGKTYTVRFRDTFGAQREKTFKTRKEAEAFATDTERGKRYGENVNLTAGKTRFTDAVETWLDTVAVGSARTRETYRSNYRANIAKAYAGLSIKDAASGRAVAQKLLNNTMAGKSLGTRRMTRQILTSVLDNLVVHGVIASHRLAGIKLAERTVSEGEYAAEYVVLTDHEVAELAARCGQWVIVQRALGLRVNEVLGLRKADFTDGTLNLKWQSDRRGTDRVSLKKRRAGEGRSIPVPPHVAAIVEASDTDVLFPGRTTTYLPYNTAQARFSNACKALGINGATTHDLRHTFASVALNAGMDVTVLAEILGHADASVTLRTYAHALPDAHERARHIMAQMWKPLARVA